MDDVTPSLRVQTAPELEDAGSPRTGRCWFAVFFFVEERTK